MGKIFQDKLKTKGSAVDLMPWQDPSYNNHYDNMVDKLFKDPNMEPESATWALISVLKLIIVDLFYKEKDIKKCSLPECQKFDTKKNFAKCAKCGSIYCGRDDQVKHWKSGHKQQCKELLNKSEKDETVSNEEKNKVENNVVAPAVDTKQTANVGDENQIDN